MSTIAVDRAQRVEEIANRLATSIHSNYPHVTTEIVHNPPGGVSAWVRVAGAADPDEKDAITSSTLNLELEALENEGILVLVL